MKPAIPNFNAEIREAKISPMPNFLYGFINLNKRRILSEKLLTIYEFQNIEYSFVPVKQIQKTIVVNPSLSDDDLEKEIVKAWLSVNNFDS